MAIYKPSNCSPYFGVIDPLDLANTYFQCEINCSNLQNGLRVNGYALTIYDEDGKQVFPLGNEEPKDHISLIDELTVDKVNNINTGYNGSMLLFPLQNPDGRNYVTNLPSAGRYTWKITLFQNV